VELDLDPTRLAICRLPAEEPIPAWVEGEARTFVSVTRTRNELSIVVAQDAVPQGVRAEPDWRALSVRGPLDLSLTGVLASLAAPLADASVPIFPIATFDTDWLLIPDARLDDAITALERAGHRVDPHDGSSL
jgi:uncharacterized protein